MSVERMALTDEYQAALIAHGRTDYRCTVMALNDTGQVLTDVPAVLLTDTRTLAAEVHKMAEQIVRDGCDPDVNALVFFWRHDTSSPAVSAVVVSRDGDASERQYMAHPVDVLRPRSGLIFDDIWNLTSSCATVTAFRFATVGADLQAAQVPDCRC